VTVMTTTRPRNNLMTEEQIVRWALRQLGAPILKVEVHPSQLADIIEDAKLWYVQGKGVIRKARISLTEGVVEYDVPDDCDMVLDLAFPGSPYDFTLVFAPYLVSDEKIPYDIFAAPESAGLYSSLAQSIQYTETAKRVLSSDLNWQFDPVERKLLVLPQPRSAYEMEITYKSTSVTFNQLEVFDFELIRRFVLAKLKVIVGGNRSKYPSFPGAQGERQLNGSELKQEGMEELRELKEDLQKANYPLPFITG